MSDTEPDEGFKIRDRRFSALSEEEKNKKQEEPKAVESGPDQAKSEAPGKIDFLSFLFSLSTSAMIQLGLIPDPHTNQTAKNLEQAKQTIDILGILEQKTRGNLTGEEGKFLQNSLTELRTRYVDSVK
ncbi:MAG: DUF1844 domain-containing protein [bacterium]